MLQDYIMENTIWNKGTNKSNKEKKTNNLKIEIWNKAKHFFKKSVKKQMETGVKQHCALYDRKQHGLWDGWWLNFKNTTVKPRLHNIWAMSWFVDIAPLT